MTGRILDDDWFAEKRKLEARAEAAERATERMKIERDLHQTKLARVRELRDELLRSDKAAALRIGRKLDAILDGEDE